MKQKPVKGHCIACKQIRVLLMLDDESGICEDCAQHMSDIGSEMR